MSAANRTAPRLLAPRLLTLAAAITASSAAWSEEAFTSAESRVQELEQRLLILERKLEIQSEEVAAKAKEAPAVTAGESGFSIKNAKGDYEIKFNALAQADFRTFLDDAPVTGGTSAKLQDGFLLRRIRPTISGSLGKLVVFRFTPELAGSGLGDVSGSNSIVDAYIDLKFSPKASVRVGKQKSQVGIERIQSGASLPFIERGLTTELVPNRNLGASVFGELAEKTISYSVGVFNGTADGREVNAVDDARKEIEGRVFFAPFKNDFSPLAGLGFGVAGTYGNKKVSEGNAASANNTLPRYRSYGQNQFYGYETGGTGGTTYGVVADGKHSRLAPQFSFYKDAFGVIGEYVVSEQEVRRVNANGATPLDKRKIKNDAYTVTATYVLTGEDASFAGVKPSNPFVLGGEGWGAFEVAARVGALDVDDDAFEGTSGVAGTRLADPSRSASEARNYGLGLNWYLNRNVKISTDYNETRFDGGAAAGADRETERALFTRVQLSY